MSDQQQIITACQGIPFDSNQYNEWLQLWSTGLCTETYVDILYTDQNGERRYNPAQLSLIQNNFNAIFDKYLNAYGFEITDDTSSPNYSVMQNIIHYSCSLLPGACDPYLTSSYCGNYTTATVAASPALLNFCGCFNLQARGLIGTPLICAGTCTKQRVIKIPDGIGGFAQCNQPVCVIDNLNITATNSANGSVNINQVCTNCGPQGCNCYINTGDINNINQQLGAVNVQQFCGPNSQCFITSNAGQPVDSVPCSSTPVVPPAFNWWLIVIIVLVVIFIIFIGLVIFSALVKR